MSCKKKDLNSLPPEELEIHLKLHRGLAEANKSRHVAGVMLAGF